MANKLAIKIVFYTLVVATAFVGGLLYYKTSTPAPQKSASVETNQPAENVPIAKTCIITVDGKKYDVEPLRTTHPGGDIYKCGTDMSDVYRGKHGTSVQRIEKYLVK
jgi:heme/copper-type cytochrome/quinol oxidase subunit 2